MIQPQTPNSTETKTLTPKSILQGRVGQRCARKPFSQKAKTHLGFRFRVRGVGLWFGSLSARDTLGFENGGPRVYGDCWRMMIIEPTHVKHPMEVALTNSHTKLRTSLGPRRF